MNRKATVQLSSFNPLHRPWALKLPSPEFPTQYDRIGYVGNSWASCSFVIPRSCSIDKTSVLALIVHCSDISHPAKDWKLHHRWTSVLLEEFFRQVTRQQSAGAYTPCAHRVYELSELIGLRSFSFPTNKARGSWLSFHRIAHDASGACAPGPPILRSYQN